MSCRERTATSGRRSTAASLPGCANSTMSISAPPRRRRRRRPPPMTGDGRNFPARWKSGAGARRSAPRALPRSRCRRCAISSSGPGRAPSNESTPARCRPRCCCSASNRATTSTAAKAAALAAHQQRLAEAGITPEGLVELIDASERAPLAPLGEKLAEISLGPRHLRVFATADPNVLLVKEKTDRGQQDYGIERDEGLVADLKLYGEAP